MLRAHLLMLNLRLCPWPSRRPRRRATWERARWVLPTLQLIKQLVLLRMLLHEHLRLLHLLLQLQLQRALLRLRHPVPVHRLLRRLWGTVPVAGRGWPVLSGWVRLPWVRLLLRRRLRRRLMRLLRLLLRLLLLLWRHLLLLRLLLLKVRMRRT